MTTPEHVCGRNRRRIGDGALAARLAREVEGEVLFDAFSRGRYSTDASHYQIEPIGVVVPKSAADVERIIGVARDEGLPVLPRGGGTSQCGQTVGEALVVDLSKFMNLVLDFDAAGRTARVEPGIVLDQLNAYLKSHGLWFPVDVSTSSRATIGGMAGNNSCGARSIRYSTMRDNVRAIEAVLFSGSTMRFAELSDNQSLAAFDGEQIALVERLLDIGREGETKVRQAFPDLMRRVGGYNVDALMPGGPPRGTWDNATVHAASTHPNLAHLLVGSEGTLAFSTALELALQPLPENKVLGVCHFPTFYDAMDSAQHIVKLGPAAVELVDRTMIELSRDIPLFHPTVERFVNDRPDAILLVEFAGPDPQEQRARLADLVELMGDPGFPDAVVEATDPDFQKAIWEVRKSGLNIMMSMKGDGKPISFIEDCAVRLEDLADYTARLTDVFHKHGTEGTWYAHASVGCLHVRSVINPKSEVGARQMRAIAEEAFEMVRHYKGSHSGEHGDGLVRSELHRDMFGDAAIELFGEVKHAFDPDGLMNPGKIVDPPKMDDRTLFRFKPGYETPEFDTALDWSEWGGFAGTVEMCNNNGACRKRDAGVMCPSYRATADEKDLTRGRANSLRLALSGQLGADALTSDAMAETMELCVGCKGCKRECPTGVDMARMKIEFLHHRNKARGLKLFDRLVAYLPRYAPWTSKLGPLLNLRNRSQGLALLGEKLAGISKDRNLPEWATQPFQDRALPRSAGGTAGRDVVLMTDTFNRYFEPQNLRDAATVLQAAGYRLHLPVPEDGTRPLCCGRTFLAAGLVDEAKAEARRTIAALKPYVDVGVAIVGLEPSCLFTLRDEFLALHPGDETRNLADKAYLFEEFVAREADDGRFDIDLREMNGAKTLLHGHCHQKAFAAMNAVEESLPLISGLEVETVESSCCGMAGAFGYNAKTVDISKTMAEMDLLPAIREASEETWIVADETSCHHQIIEGSGRTAQHVVNLLAASLAGRPSQAGPTE